MDGRSELFTSLDLRRRELGMAMGTLAKKSGLSLRTVARILSGDHANASWANVMALADVLGIAVELRSIANPEDLRERQAKWKADRLVKMVQGTSALEGQAVDSEKVEQMKRRTVHELLAGSDRKLWAE
jgi:transcriptional regulator with XRE-family HTH domain